MADFFNPSTGSIHRSVHTPDAKAAGWINISGTVERVRAIPSYYRVADGSTVREATDKEKQQIDMGRLEQLKMGRRSSLANIFIRYLEGKRAAELSTAMQLATPKYLAMVAAIENAMIPAEVAAVTLTLQ